MARSSSSSKQQHPAPTPEKMIPTYRKGNKVKISSNCPKTTTLKIRNPKIPNTKVPTWAHQDDNQYNHIAQFLLKHPIYHTLGGVPRVIYAEMIFEFWATCKKNEKSLSGTVLNGSKMISFTADEVRKCLRLREGTVKPLSHKKAKKDLLSRIAYTGKLDKKVERKYMQGIWNYFFAHISECVGLKSGGFDQPNGLEIQIAHALVTDRNVDYASLLTQDLIDKASAKMKSNCVPYVRILGLLIEHGLNGDFTGATGPTVQIKELGPKVFMNPSTGQRLSRKMKVYIKPSIRVQGDDDDLDNDNDNKNDDDEGNDDENDDDEGEDHNDNDDDEGGDHNDNDDENDDDVDDNDGENDDDDQVNPSSHDTLEIRTHPSTRVTDSLVQQQTMEDLISKAVSVMRNAVTSLAGSTNYADDILAKVQKQQDDTRSLLTQAVACVNSARQECVSKFDAMIQALESKLCEVEEDPFTIATKKQPQVNSLVAPQTVPDAIDDTLEEENVEYHSPPVKKRRVVVNQDDPFNDRKGMLMAEHYVQQHDSEDKTMMDVSESTAHRLPSSSMGLSRVYGHPNPRKKLLLLDLNGLLVDIVADADKNYIPDTQIGAKHVFKRPYCDEFLKFCFERFDVGIWTSRKRKNLDPVLSYLMKDTEKKFIVTLDQEYCNDTGHTTIENPAKPLFIKELKLFWFNQNDVIPDAEGVYNASNTVLLDDSPYKGLLNPPNNAIFPFSYSYRDTKDTGLGPGGELRCYLERLARSDNVQKFIQQNPFGQQPISSDENWEFYIRVITDVINRKRKVGDT